MPTGDEHADTVSAATAEFLGVGGTQSRGASRFGFKSEAPLSLPVALAAPRRFDLRLATPALGSPGVGAPADTRGVYR
jgi:hypothetical protein